MDTEKICRTCLGLTGPFLSIFDDTTGNSTGSIADMLRNFTKTKPKPADNMPEKVCLTCISEINRCYSFKLKCEQSNRTLRQLLPDAVPEEPDIINNPTVALKPPVLTANKSIQTTPIRDIKKRTVSKEVQTLEYQRKDVDKEELAAAALPITEIQQVTKMRKCVRRAKSIKAIKVVRDEDDVETVDVEEDSEIYEITRGLSNTDEILGKNDDTKNKRIILHVSKGEDDGEYTEMIFNETTGELRTHEDLEEEPIKQEKRVKNTEEYKFTIYNNENGEEEFAPSTSVTTRKRKRPVVTQGNTATTDASSPPNKITRTKRSGVEKAKEIVEEMENEYKKRCRLLNSNADNEDYDDYGTSDEKLEKPKLKHICERCNAGFAVLKSLIIHKRNNNCLRVNFKCDECNRVFISEEHLIEHRSIHTSKSVPCAECSEIFETKEELSKHMIDSHKRSSKNKCNVCQKVFTMLSALRDHIRIHTGEKPFVCQICNKGFTQSANMRQHMFRHSSTKRFQCDQCDSSFVTKAELMAHNRSHTGDKPFECEICKAKFTTSSSLIKHKRKHTGEIPYGCEMCPMRFTALNVLKNHRRTHTGEKPFKCAHCTRRFTQNGDCVMHQRTHFNSNKDNVCSVCNKDFKSAADMKRHIKTHTNSDKSLHVTLEQNKKDGNVDAEEEGAGNEKTKNNVETQEFLQMTMDSIC